MDFSNLKLAQCSNFKMLKSILDDGIIYFEQKILLSLTNLSYHSLNILINMSPYSTCIFSPQKQLSFITFNWRKKSVHGHTLQNLYASN